jgi:hypothetical protein
MKTKISVLVLAGALLFGFQAALAQELYVVVAGGVGKKITSLPYTISEPGFYYVTKNLTLASGHGITVNADDVTIDLMGFSLTGNSSYIGIKMSQRKNVAIRNGTLRGWYYGIYESNYGTSHQVSNVRIEENTYGVKLTGGNHLVQGCTCDEVSTCIVVDFGKIIGNQMSNCFKGIAMNNVGTIRDNEVSLKAFTGAIGITLSVAGAILGNTVNCPSGTVGILLESDTNPILVQENTVVNSGTHYKGGSTNVTWGTNAGRP